jgi:molybdopterin-guanine dinucleotide biosynthesis protein A
MRDLAARSGATPVLVGGPGGELADPVPGAGPVASLWALARAAPGDSPSARWVVIPVDMPVLAPSLLRRLAAAGPRAVFFSGHPLPLALTMDRVTRDTLERRGERLAAGESVSVHSILDALNAERLDPDAAERDQLVNANTPEEWERLVRKVNP